MVTFFDTPPWDELMTECLDAGPSPVDSVKYSNHIERWLPYIESGLVKEPQTEARHLMFALDVVTPVVTSLLKDACIFDVNQVREKVAGYFSADTDCFNQHTQNTSIEDIVFGAIERIAVLCYALEQYQLLLQAGDRNAPQILVDTLNLEVPHLNNLSGQLPGFRQKLWSDEISKACGEYVSDFADFQHYVLTKQDVENRHIEALDTEQLPDTFAISQ